MSNTRHATKRSEGHNETVMLGRVTGSHNFTVSVGKEEKKGGFLTASTFRKIEVSMDMSRNSILKLKKILKEEVSVDKGIREALKSWDNLGADQLVLHRIENFEVKVAKQEGKQEKGTSAVVDKITRDVVIVKYVAETLD